MFEKSTIEAYRQAKAPEGLRERVMDSYHRNATGTAKHHLYRAILVMASCLVLIFSVATFVNQDDVSILFCGQEVSREPRKVDQPGLVRMQGGDSAISAHNAMEGTCVALEVEAGDEMTLKASSGEMHVFAAETGELIAEGMECLVSGTVTVEWSVEEVDEATLHVTSGKEQQDICLQYAEDDETWVIYRK